MSTDSKPETSEFTPEECPYCGGTGTREQRDVAEEYASMEGGMAHVVAVPGPPYSVPCDHRPPRWGV